MNQNYDKDDRYGDVYKGIFTTFASYLDRIMKMIKIMFVCHGNICRSPMAEFVFKRMVYDAGILDQFVISSSATSTEEIHMHGSPVYPPARRELAKHGISCEGKFAVQITAADYKKYDYLILMDHNNLHNIQRIVGEDTEKKIWKLYDFAPCAETSPVTVPIRLSGRDISDPWYTGDFAQTYHDIELGCRGLLVFLGMK